MSQTTTPEEIITKVVAAFADVDRIILFGSRARGDAAPRSDVDVAVECPKATDRMWARIVDAVEEANTLYFTDLVRLDRAPAALKRKIEREGRVLYERS